MTTEPPTIVLPARYRSLLDGVPGEVLWYETPEEALELARGCDAIWVSGFTSAEVIGKIVEGSPRLRWLHYSSTGVDHLPLGLFRERPVVFTNGAGLYSQPISEHVVMCLLAARLNLLGLLREQAASTWSGEVESDEELAGSTVLILGYGELGHAIARRLRSLEVNVLAARRRGAVPAGEDAIDAGDWRSRLPEVDFLIVTLPSTPETRGIVGTDELGRIKPGAWLVNVSRGNVVDEDALVEALRSGRLGGAALDAFAKEPLDSGHPFWLMPNVILSPHSSWRSWRLAEREVERFRTNLDNFLADRPLRNVVDPAAGY